jgi:hypothetical protein
VVAEGYDGVTRDDAMALNGQTSRFNLILHEDVTSVETIHGSVVNNYGEPMASTVITIGPTHTILSEANGSFVLVAEDLEGWQTITASSSGFETVHRSIEITPGSTMSVDFVLSVSDGWSVSVRGMVVKAQDGKAIEGGPSDLAGPVQTPGPSRRPRTPRAVSTSTLYPEFGAR